MVGRIKREFTLRDWIWLCVLLMAGAGSYARIGSLAALLKDGFVDHESRITELEKQEYIRQGYEKALLDLRRAAADSDGGS